MRPAEEWLHEYAKSHRNPTNKRIHYFCVPAIVWSCLAMLWPLNARTLGLCGWMSASEFPLFPIGLVVFVVAWIVQFVGHKIEGRKPSFLHDLVFLMIGPLWIMNSTGRVFDRRGRSGDEPR